jgi:flavin reductase (DIM6/NTAB) family NADH-FMN oxidoreductase RutF
MHEQPLEMRAFRQAMGHFATGVTVITAQAGGAIHGMTANAVTSLSLEPMLLLICVDRRAKMLGVIQQAGSFAVNVLTDAQEPLSRHFSGKGAAPPPSELRFEPGSGAPLVADALASLTCRVEEMLAGGDHMIITGRVTALRTAPEGRKPLLFFKGRYHHLQTPDLAATPAPEVWHSDSVAVYHEAWPDPFRRAMPGEGDPR